MIWLSGGGNHVCLREEVGEQQQEEERDVRSPKKSQKSQRACEEGGGWSKAAAGRTDGGGRALHPFICPCPACLHEQDYLHTAGWQPFTFLWPSSSSCPVQHQPGGGTSSASTLKHALRLPPPPLHPLPRKPQSGFQRRRSLRRGVRVALGAPGA